MERDTGAWVLAMLTGLGILTCGISMAHSQTPIPDVVRPRTDAPATTGDTSRAIPESGIIRPPSAASSTPVIQPPAMGTMPVIPPPGSAGGDRSVVPK